MVKGLNTKNILKFLAFAIPIGILLWVIYLNVLPFGYSKEFTIELLEDGTVISSSPSEVYLEDLNGERIENLSFLYGVVNLVVKPKAVLNNASMNISLDSDNVFLGVTPEISEWDYEFDFTSGIPPSLVGNATYDNSRNCTYFDGNSRLYLPNSHDDFENGSFVVYAEWIPESNASFQQIVGHYNWELLQYGDKIRFMVGRMNTENQSFTSLIGNIYYVNQEIDDKFFNQDHSALVIYSQKEIIGVFVDNNFIQVTNLDNETIWRDYNEKRDLSMGKSEHGVSNYFSGCLKGIKFSHSTINYTKKSTIILNNKVLLPIFGKGKFNSMGIIINR